MLVDFELMVVTVLLFGLTVVFALGYERLMGARK